MNSSNLYSKIALIIFGGVLVWAFTNFHPSLKLSPTQNTKALSSPESCSESNTIQTVKNAVVKIETDESTGTGFVIKKASGEKFIVTNYHVVKNAIAPKIIYSDGSPAVGKLYNWDEEVDLATIKIDRDDTDTLEFGDSNILRNGQNLITVGYPFGSMLTGEATVTKGNYAAKRTSDTGGVEYLQFDASINPGNSGSPVVDQCGKVMGIVTLSISGAQGLGFAISSKTAKTMVESLVSNGPKKVEDKFQLADKSTLVGTVAKFYDYISTRQLELAFDLMTPKLQQEFGGKDSFIKGYDSTLNVYLQDIQAKEQNTVFVKLFAADLVGDRALFRSFVGTWELVQEDGIWKLNSANITQAQ